MRTGRGSGRVICGGEDDPDDAEFSESLRQPYSEQSRRRLMAEAHFALDARRDLVSIADYIAEDNPTAALRWIDAIEGFCNLSAPQPNLGETLLTNRYGRVRCADTAGKYLIYYRWISGGLEILAVVHGSRDQGHVVKSTISPKLPWHRVPSIVALEARRL